MRRALGCAGVALGVVLLLAAGATLLLWTQARRRSTGPTPYVALGSSFAAGIGLGERAAGSPVVCQRTTSGYPAKVARRLALTLVDMSCSAATTRHVLYGGQVFQGPQVDAIRPETLLVTLTSGGNDIRYVGDLAFMAGTRERSLRGWAMRRLWSGPLASTQRDFAGLHDLLRATFKTVRQRAPHARIVVITYPRILPPAGTCSRLNITETQADTMREVGRRLADTTRVAALEAGADLIDMERIGAAHHACSNVPWVNGWVDAQGTAFHPTSAGATAVADEIVKLVQGRARR